MNSVVNLLNTKGMMLSKNTQEPWRQQQQQWQLPNLFYLNNKNKFNDDREPYPMRFDEGPGWVFAKQNKLSACVSVFIWLAQSTRWCDTDPLFYEWSNVKVILNGQIHIEMIRIKYDISCYLPTKKNKMVASIKFNAIFCQCLVKFAISGFYTSMCGILFQLKSYKNIKS